MKCIPRLFLVVLACAVAGGAAFAQAQSASWAKPPDVISVSDGTRLLFNTVSGYLAKSADKVSEEIYAFKPTPEVRTFGQIIAHVAEGNYGMCAAVLGEKTPVEGLEKSKTTKAELVKAFADSTAYCQRAFKGLTDANATELVPFFGQKMARVSILDLTSAEAYTHYGNLVTYMRLKGIVPPSSERGPR